MIRRVIVLGGGSAGLLAALTLKAKIPTLSVTVIQSRDIGIIGVGESTTVAVPVHLHGYLDIDPGEFYRQAEPTWKLGIRFLWGPRPFFDYTFTAQTDWKHADLPKYNGFYCDDDFSYIDVQSSLMSLDRAFLRQPNGDPLIGRDFGYHLDNEKFVAFLQTKAAEMRIEIIDDTVVEVRQNDQGIRELQLRSGMVQAADLYIDSSGFRAVLLAGSLAEPFISFGTTLYCDRAVTGGWDRTDEPIKPYTTAETMNHGWCWQIEHEHRVVRGYVYSSSFVTHEEAEREFRAKNPKVQTTRLVKFSSGRYRDSWVKNVVAVGNASGFVEPLESTSLAAICSECLLLTEILRESDQQPTPSLRRVFNQIVARGWDAIRNFLGVHYRFNSRLDTPFWRACRADVELGAAEMVVDFYRENGPSPFARYTALPAGDIFGMEGYLTLLLGQKVPHACHYVPAERETALWNKIRAENRVKAVNGLTIPEALTAIRAPNWTWYPGYYRNAVATR